MKRTEDEQFMAIAIREAKKAMGRTSPNPCVGAVIVKDGVEVSRGYHKKAGTPHAEIHAIRNAGSNTIGSTIYVTLEPCNHTGKTPPCSHAIVKAGIQKVVIGVEDPNPLVDGSGIAYLKSHGVEVVLGILEEQCRVIVKPFIKRITTGLPFVALKAGISIDGKINYQKGKSGWITGPESSQKVHNLRDQYDAILVGRGTIEIDNPSLTTRVTKKEGRDPLRVILDSRLSIAVNSKVVQQESDAETHIYCCKGADPVKKKALIELGVFVHETGIEDGKVNLLEVLRSLSALGINSVLVEGGAMIHGAFLKEQLADVGFFFQAPLFAGDYGVTVVDGISSESKSRSISMSEVKYERMGEDILLSGNFCYPSK